MSKPKHCTRYANIPVAGQPCPNIRVFQRGARRYANFRGEQKGGGTRLAAVCRLAEQRRIKVAGAGGGGGEVRRGTIPRGVSGRWEMGKGDSRNEGRRRMGISASRTNPLNLNGLSNNVTYVSPLTSRSSLNA